MTTMFWLQAGSCGGETMAILSADRPSFTDLLDNYQLELLWQPSLSTSAERSLQQTIDAILSDEQPLDILCIEGSVITAPDGTGMFDTYRGRSKMSIIVALAAKANYVVAMGTCAAFGGVHAAPPNPSDCMGLQFDKKQMGGLFEPQW